MTWSMDMGGISSFRLMVWYEPAQSAEGLQNDADLDTPT